MDLDALPVDVAPWAQLLASQSLGDYKIGDLLGFGNFSLVFEAVHGATSAQHAMKILLPGASGPDQIDFIQEGALLSRLARSSRVITLVETGQSTIQVNSGTGVPVPLPLHFHVFAMASGNLEELVEDPDVLAQLSWAERVDIWRDAVLGVHQAHLKDVAHRDLKSSNCLLVVQGSITEARIGDFGRAKDLRAPSRGLPLDYMDGRGDLRVAPPEYLFKQGGNSAADCKNADLYGLGSLLFELGTGHSITGAALGPLHRVMAISEQERSDGITRDLATLRPRYRLAIQEFTETLPPVIRAAATELVTQLCDPVSTCRQPRSSPGRREPRPNELHWLIRRADILKNLVTSDHHRTQKTPHTTASRSA